MVVVGAFGPGNTYSGRSVTWDAGVFTVEGLGATALDTLRESEASGQFVWASPETRAWAEGLAGGVSVPPALAQTSAGASSPASSEEAAAAPATQVQGGSFSFRPWMAVAAIALLLAAGAVAALAMQPHPGPDPGRVVIGPLDTPSRTVGPDGPTNSAPVAADDSYAAVQDTPLTISAAEGVLANDTDADGDTLSVTQSFGPLHGSATIAADGSFTYTPKAGYSGSDYLTYSVSDGRGGTAAGAADFSVTPVTHTDPTVVVPPKPKPKPVYTKHTQIRVSLASFNFPFYIAGWGWMNNWRNEGQFYASGGRTSKFTITRSELNRHAIAKTKGRSAMVNGLVKRLKKAGWTVTGRGAEWFAIKLSK